MTRPLTSTTLTSSSEVGIKKDNSTLETGARTQVFVCNSLLQMSGHKDVVVVDVQFAGMGDTLAEFASVSLTECHNMPGPVRVRDLEH